MGMADAFAAVAAGFSRAGLGPYRDAVARWPGEPVRDDGGSIIVPGVPYEMPCLCQVDSATEAMRSADGYVDTDVRLLILAAGLPRAIDTDATVEVGGRRWSVQTAVLDPMGAYWDCRGRRGT